MSRIYDNWEKLVEAVLRREKDRQLALFESFSSSIFSSRPSFDSDVSNDSAVPSSHRIFVSRTIKAIQFEEIKLSTQNFQADMLLGEGRFGPVSKGWIHEHFLTAVKPGSGIAVAIKKLNKREIFCLNQPRHPNVVQLIGYSFDEGNRVLVYEFMPNGSLDNHLFTRGHQLLSWETRVKVAIGAARGLSFFHNLSILVTHEGVKSSSILLDDEFNAKWSDIDLTTVPVPTHMSTRVMNEYAAPEYIATGQLTMKSDVYSFGIILLELLSGSRVCDKDRPTEEQNLVVWAKPYLSKKRELLQFVDRRLEGQYPHVEAYKIGKLASKCLSLNKKLRPCMTEVVDTLEQFGSHYHQNPPKQLPTGIDRQVDSTESSNWSIIGPGGKFFMDEGSNHFGSADFPSLSIFGLHNAIAIKFDVLKRATRDFQSDFLLGEGILGPVYKGMIQEHPLTAVKLESGIFVAVKKLTFKRLAGRHECLNHIINLSQLPHHPNLVKLIGYCFEADNRILVYEFVLRGGLDYHLFTRWNQSLHWEERLKVALGTARALAFLHVSTSTPIPYKDFNSANILLDGEFNAKLSGYGLAGVADTTGSLKVGYEAPEYVETGHLSAKSNVYSFGVVLLELLSGRRAYDRNKPSKEQKLVEYAMPYLGSQRKVLQIIDPRLEGQYPRKEVCKVSKLASCCLSQNPRSRPTMSEVVAALEQP